jgi:hypothetical protein
MSTRKICSSLGMIAFLWLTAGCNFPLVKPETTSSGPATMAARTLAVVFTKAAQATPMGTSAAPEPVVEDEMDGASEGQPEDECTNRATFVEDVTIRDNSQLMAGERFVKIWRLMNDGTCKWTRSYALIFFGGDRMGAPKALPLSEEVPPYGTIDLAVDMTAPDQHGIHQGFWRLKSESGELFGIGSQGDHSIWVKIQVTSLVTPSSTTSLTPTSRPTGSAIPTPSATPTISPRPTQAVHEQGTLVVELGIGVDLDAGDVSSSQASDLVFELVDGTTSISPRNESRFASLPDDVLAPTYPDCETLEFSDEPLELLPDAQPIFLCYQTSEGRLGFFELTNSTPPFSLHFTTWAQ